MVCITIATIHCPKIFVSEQARRVSIKEKLEIIERRDEGEAYSQISTEYGIINTAVHLIMKSRERYEQYKDKANIQSYKKIPFERFTEVDKELKKYVDAANKCNLGLSYQVMREQALKTFQAI